MILLSPIKTTTNLSLPQHFALVPLAAVMTLMGIPEEGFQLRFQVLALIHQSGVLAKARGINIGILLVYLMILKTLPRKLLVHQRHRNVSKSI
jgi:hypothetical protein